MKTYIPYSILLAVAATGLSQAAETAYTTPVGYVSLGDTTTGQPAVKANTDVAISVPLNRPTEYAGAVTSATANSITITGAGWTANQWNPGAATPYLVTVKSGTENGFIGLITANTADTLTVTPVTGGSLASVAAGSKIQINKAWTIASVFPTGTVPNQTRLLVYAGTTNGINLSPSTTYTYNSTNTNWAAGPTVANNVILYPGESFVVRTPAGATIASLVLAGEVPVANSRAYIDKLTAGSAQDTRLSYFGAGDEIIGASGLVTSLGLVTGDRLLAFNNNAAGINKSPNETLTLGANGRWAIGPTDVTDTYTLKAGRGYVIRRVQGAPVGSLDWKDAPTYVSGLGL